MRKRTVKWHEQNVILKAKDFARVYVTTVGFGAPIARAGMVLNEAVEQLEAAYAHKPYVRNNDHETANPQA